MVGSYGWLHCTISVQWQKKCWLVLWAPLKDMSQWDDYPIYYGKLEKKQTTNQIVFNYQKWAIEHKLSTKSWNHQQQLVRILIGTIVLKTAQQVEYPLAMKPSNESDNPLIDDVTLLSLGRSMEFLTLYKMAFANDGRNLFCEFSKRCHLYRHPARFQHSNRGWLARILWWNCKAYDESITS